MTARDEVESILSERGPATVAEIAEALSNVYTPHTVSVAVARLKKAGTVVRTGDKVQGDRGRPAEVVALNRELERARNKKTMLDRYYVPPHAATAGTEWDGTIFMDGAAMRERELLPPLDAERSDGDVFQPEGERVVSGRYAEWVYVTSPKPSVWQRVKRLFGVG